MRCTDITTGSILRSPQDGPVKVEKIMDVGWAANEPPKFSAYRQPPFEIWRGYQKRKDFVRMVVTMRPLLRRNGQCWMFPEKGEHRKYELIRQGGD